MRPRNRSRGRRPGAPPPSRAARGEARSLAKGLLGKAGERIERGDLPGGGALLEQAVGADPDWVEPVLALATFRARYAGDRGVDELIEEAVHRGGRQLERTGKRREDLVWWWDAATRPYMRALLARGLRLLDLGRPRDAARELYQLYLLEREDPLEAGLQAAEALLQAGDPGGALELYARLAESPGLAYGRAVALLAAGEGVSALVSLWLGVLLNGRVALALLPPGATLGIDARTWVGDPEEAQAVRERIAEVWTEEAGAALELLVADPGLRDDLVRWAELNRAHEEAAGEDGERRALQAIEEFLDADRVEASVREALGRGRPRRRLPLAP